MHRKGSHNHLHFIMHLLQPVSMWELQSGLTAYPTGPMPITDPHSVSNVFPSVLQWRVTGHWERAQVTVAFFHPVYGATSIVDCHAWRHKEIYVRNTCGCVHSNVLKCINPSGQQTKLASRENNLEVETCELTDPFEREVQMSCEKTRQVTRGATHPTTNNWPLTLMTIQMSAYVDY